MNETNKESLIIAVTIILVTGIFVGGLLWSSIHTANKAVEMGSVRCDVDGVATWAPLFQCDKS